MNTSNALQYLYKGALEHSPAILTGLGITGFIFTAHMMVEAVDELREIQKHDTPTDQVEILKQQIPPFLPVIGMGLVSAACILGSHSVTTRRTHALASLYAFTDKTLREYRDVVKKTVSKRKNEEIDDEVAKYRIDEHPLEASSVIFMVGEIVCLDSYSGRYFKTDSIETLRRIANDTNVQLASDMFVSLNEFYLDIGLEPIKDGDQLGWDAGETQLDLIFTAKVADGKPVLVMDYDLSHRWANAGERY